MASFFGFGRRKNESDIPLSDSSHHSDYPQQQDSVTSPRAASPPPRQEGPPPMYPTFVPSPVLSPPGSNGSNKPILEPSNTESMAMPDIHVFDPSAESYDENPNDFEEDDDEQAVQMKPSVEEANYSHWQQPGVETVLSGENDESFEDQGDGRDDIHQFVGASQSQSEEESLPAPSSEEVEEDSQQDHLPVHSTPPLRETVADTNHGLGTSTYSYSDDSRTTTTPNTPSSINTNNYASNRFRTPTGLKRDDFISYDENEAVETVMPPKSPRDEIFTPKFKEVHAKTVRRRQNHQQNMQNLERRLASITTKLANLTMDRQAKECHWFRDNVCMPMEDATQRLSIEKEYLSSPHYTGTKHWLAFTKLVSRFETEMAERDHVTFPKLVREALEQPYIDLNDESLAFANETRKSEKREGNIFRQFESVAATARRRYHEERAARTSAYQVMRQELVQEAKMETDPKRIEELLAKVRVLRSMLEQERVERRMQDENLKTSIEQEVISMKRALLEAAGGDDVIEENSEAKRTIAYS